jgi:DnaK suppressor protein
MTNLTRAQLDVFRQRLLAERDAVANLLEQTSSDVRPVDLGLPIGRLSRMDAMQMQGMAQLNRRQLEVRQQRITVALAALDEANYGSCRNCKAAISVARLEAQPEVPFCLACQESFEAAD